MRTGGSGDAADSSLGVRRRHRRPDRAVGQTRQRRNRHRRVYIVAFIKQAGMLAQQLIWAVDIIGSPSALLLGLLARADQTVHYASGRVAAAMGAAYTGEGKTDAKDAHVIAETARLRRDLTMIDDDTDLVRNLAILTAHRTDLIADRVRMINRLRDLLTSVFPSLERAFDYSAHKGALGLPTRYASPARIRRRGRARLAQWLQHRKVRGADEVAARALGAAEAQSIVLPGQELTASIVSDLAATILALDDRVKALDKKIDHEFKQHPQAEIIVLMPGWTAGRCRGSAGIPDRRSSCRGGRARAGAERLRSAPAICTDRCATAGRYVTCPIFRRRPA